MNDRLIKDSFYKWQMDIDELLKDLTEDNLLKKAELYQRRTNQLLKLFDKMNVLKRESISKEFFFEPKLLIFRPEIRAIFSQNNKFLRKEVRALRW